MPDRCPRCNSDNTYVRADGALQCRTCHYTGLPAENQSEMQAWRDSVMGPKRR